MTSTLRKLEEDIESATGKSAKSLREKTICEIREQMEAEGHPLTFKSEHPFIGRGNVLRDKIISRKNVNRSLDKALR